MSTKCSVTETVKHFWVSGCKFSRCLRPGFCFSHFHYSRCPPEVFTKPIMNSVGVVGQVYPFPFSLLLPGAFLTYEALSWMAPLHFHDLLVQPAAWRRLWNTGSVQICERLFCVLVFFLPESQMFMAGIMSLAKQGADWQSMLPSGNKSHWHASCGWINETSNQPLITKQPASYATSRTVPNGFLWRSNGEEIQHQPALSCRCSKKNTMRERRHLLAGRKSILLLCMASTCLPFPFPTRHSPRFEDKGTDWDRRHLPFHWGFSQPAEVVQMVSTAHGELLEVKPSLLGVSIWGFNSWRCLEKTMVRMIQAFKFLLLFVASFFHFMPKGFVLARRRCGERAFCIASCVTGTSALRISWETPEYGRGGRCVWWTVEEVSICQLMVGNGAFCRSESIKSLLNLEANCMFEMSTFDSQECQQ